ncbi:hypothetical protein Vretimale_11007, partial [Volvox reticuliferus]
MRCLGPLPRAHMARMLIAGGQLAAMAATPPTRSRTLRQRLPEVGLELLDLITACLTPDPRKRPTAQELLQMPYFWGVPRLLPGSDLIRQLPYAADLVCTISGTAAPRQTSGLHCSGGGGGGGFTVSELLVGDAATVGSNGRRSAGGAAAKGQADHSGHVSVAVQEGTKTKYSVTQDAVPTEPTVRPQDPGSTGGSGGGGGGKGPSSGGIKSRAGSGAGDLTETAIAKPQSNVAPPQHGSEISIDASPASHGGSGVNSSGTPAGQNRTETLGMAMTSTAPAAVRASEGQDIQFAAEADKAMAAAAATSKVSAEA